MTLLTRELSMSHPPLLKTEKIPVPEFGEGMELAVRGLTAGQRGAFGRMAQKADTDEAKGPDLTCYLITLAAIDADGKTMYQTQDCDNIAGWPGDLVGRIGDVIMEMSGLVTDPKVKKSESKPSDETGTGSGPTASPETSDAPSTS